MIRPLATPLLFLLILAAPDVVPAIDVFPPQSARSLGPDGYCPSECGVDPDCPYCDDDVYPSNPDPLLSVSMKWCGISEAPCVADPTLVCRDADDFRTMLWRRHERASECVWIDQAAITLRSGGAVERADYVEFPDLEVGVGDPGDVQICDPCGAADFTFTTEANDTWEMCDMEWADQPKGVIAVHANNLLDQDGVPVARGVVFDIGNITYPWLMSADPCILCQANERSLAHEAGHILSLVHRQVGGALMQSGGTGSDLNAAEIDQAREYLEDNTILDPPPGPVGSDLVGLLFDPRGDGVFPFTDVRKMVVFDNYTSSGKVAVFTGVGGTLPTSGNVIYQSALDTDNNPSTGGNTNDVVPGWNVPGVEVLISITVTPDSLPGTYQAQTTLFRAQQGSLIPFTPPPGTVFATAKNGRVALCDPYPTYTGPTEIPMFAEISCSLTSKALVALGYPGSGVPRFPAGLRMQVRARHMQGIDLAPNQPTTMRLPAITFPTLTIPQMVARGAVIPAHVVDMSPNVFLKVIMGDVITMPGVQTNGKGQANFDYTVPLGVSLGRTVMTVGNLSNALTADAATTVVEPGSVEETPALEPTTRVLSSVAVSGSPGLGRLELSLSMTRQGLVSVQVYNLAGSFVRTLFEGSLEQGRHAFVWDGRDQVGRPMPSGLYFFEVMASGEKATRKAVLLR